MLKIENIFLAVKVNADPASVLFNGRKRLSRLNRDEERCENVYFSSAYTARNGNSLVEIRLVTTVVPALHHRLGNGGDGLYGDLGTLAVQRYHSDLILSAVLAVVARDNTVLHALDGSYLGCVQME